MVIKLSKNRIDLGKEALQNAALQNYSQSSVVSNYGTLTAGQLNLSTANIFYVTLDANAIFSFKNASSGTGTEFQVFTKQGPGNYSVIWPRNVRWPDSITPTTSPVNGQIDWYTFRTTDGGVTWYGTSVASNLKALQRLFTWGYDGYGDLGLGDTINRSSPTQVGLNTWSDISAGTDFAVTIRTGGTLWTWGFNNNGQSSGASSPVQMGTLTTWSSVAGQCSYGHSGALHSDGTLWMWGYGRDYGNLGNGTNTDSGSPTQVGALTTWSSVTCNNYNSLSIRTDGTLWGWGSNVNGELGLSNATSYSSPVQVGTLTTWSSVACQMGSSTEAIRTDGTLWAWGLNSNGQLGQGDIVNRSSPVQVGTITTWSSVMNSMGNDMGATRTDGTLWLWGQNNYGQHGRSNTIDCSSPIQVGTLTTWSSVRGGADHAVGTRTDGTLWAWGLNSNGQLGQGDIVNRSSPVQVGTLSTWGKVVSGNSHIEALLS